MTDMCAHPVSQWIPDQDAEGAWNIFCNGCDEALEEPLKSRESAQKVIDQFMSKETN